MNDIFIDVDYHQMYKTGQKIGEDVFLQSKHAGSNQIVCTLSDGLGSGVKANVLANLTAHMAHKLSFSPLQITKSAKIIMNTLPVCSERKISYSTFTIADIRCAQPHEITAQLIEYDNPPVLHFCGPHQRAVKAKRINLDREGAYKDEVVRQSSLTLGMGDRLIMFTDGVTQSGMGKPFPLGWRHTGVARYISDLIEHNPDISSRELSASITRKAFTFDAFSAKDDITCAVVYVRRPRRTLVVTGPPFTRDNDELLMQKVHDFNGKKIISGGTTAQIISRLMGKNVSVDLSSWSTGVPPASKMEGIDLVTEGMLTLAKVATALEQKIPIHTMGNDAVRRFVSLMLDSDQVYFIVGTKINEAHQDPNIPVEIGIRRTIVGRIRTALEQQFLKETALEYV